MGDLDRPVGLLCLFLLTSLTVGSGAQGTSAEPEFEVDTAFAAAPTELAVGGRSELRVQVSLFCKGPRVAVTSQSIEVHHVVEVEATVDAPIRVDHPPTTYGHFEGDDCIRSVPVYANLTVGVHLPQGYPAHTQIRLKILSTVGEDGPRDEIQWNATVPRVGSVRFEDASPIYAHVDDALGRVVGPVPVQVVVTNSINAALNGTIRRHFMTDDGIDVKAVPFAMGPGERLPLRLEANLSDAIRERSGSYRLWLAAEAWMVEPSVVQVVDEDLMLKIDVVNAPPPAPPEGMVFVVWLIVALALIILAWVAGGRRRRDHVRNR